MGFYSIVFILFVMVLTALFGDVIDYDKVDFISNEKTDEGFLTIMVTFLNGDVMAYLYKELKDYIRDLTYLIGLGIRRENE